ncbi:MAG: UDP-glucose 4-epimerase GalE [Bacteroidales bacterium]
MKMKVLVTGGTGYIGSHTAVELLNQGHDVIIADNLSNSREEVIDAIIEITGKDLVFENIDLSDADMCEDFFERNSDIDAIIHFAAFKAVGESVEKPLAYYQNNIFSLINILQGMEKYNIRKFVFSSSCTVYGQPDHLPVDENAPIKKAESPYGNTKKIAEDIISDTCNASKLSAIALRYFNPIGSHDSALIGELPLGVPNNLVPFITQTAIGIRKELKVFGDDYNTPDGTAVRDYIHVVDLAQAHVVAVERLEKNPHDQMEIFNLGTGKGSSVLEVIHSFERVSGEKLNWTMAKRRAGDTEQVWADTRYANEELGWKSKRSLDDAMKSAWEWEKKFRANEANEK